MPTENSLDTIHDSTPFWRWCWLDGQGHHERPDRSRTSQRAQELLLSLARDTLPECDISFQKDKGGRPWITANGKLYHASISHSRRLIAVALNPAGPVGIDVEFRDPGRRIASLTRWLTEQGYEVPEGDFYRGWCRYEASLKALGKTLPSPMALTVSRCGDWPEYEGALAWGNAPLMAPE
ncbi:4'-phosphopantetheinyl transferase family protein [Radicibacter daui]|uniref:4'-phosphopantetheinyl transferase family protein n=1 Tax=Radicibacter daui TaxID=3064829 RepID=UPI004046CB83